MLMNTHRRIAERIAEELELNSDMLVSCLRKGSTAPDRWKDFPHHYGKENEIRKRVVEARKLFLHDVRSEAFFRLGVALHYIQDGWVTVSGSHPQHNVWENDIARSPFVNDLEGLVRWAASNHFFFDGVSNERVEGDKERYLEIIERLYDFEESCRDNFEDCDGYFVKGETLSIATLERPVLGLPVLDLNFARRTSLAVALAVCTSKESPVFEREVEEGKRAYMEKLKQAEKERAEKLFELSKKKADLERKGGFINKLKKMVCAYNFWFYKRAYDARKHLKKVQRSYKKEAERLMDMYREWYNVTRPPPLNIKQVKRLFNA